MVVITLASYQFLVGHTLPTPLLPNKPLYFSIIQNISCQYSAVKNWTEICFLVTRCYLLQNTCTFVPEPYKYLLRPCISRVPDIVLLVLGWFCCHWTSVQWIHMLVLSSQSLCFRYAEFSKMILSSKCSQAVYCLLTEFCLPAKYSETMANASARVAQAPVTVKTWPKPAHLAVYRVWQSSHYRNLTATSNCAS